MNALTEHNAVREREIEKKKADVLRRREETGYVPYGDYFLPDLESDIRDMLAHSAYAAESPHLSFIDRAAQGADVALRFPSLLKEKGAAEYARDVVPEIVSLLAGLSDENPAVASVSSVGIYVNLTLTDSGLMAALADVAETVDANGKNRYGESDVYAGARAVCEYSSPNVAKHLHAGHIRSTIVGESLARIYQAVGYVVHRVNHVNDWGGFGFLLEGWDRWHVELGDGLEKNEALYRIYLRYRELENVGGSAWEEFKAASNVRFRALEAGDEETVRRWGEMIGWSMEEFEEFYRRFGISFEYVIGESFYAARGQGLVEGLLAKEIAEKKDGAVVIPLPGERALVVRRSDGASIYATRDLAALEHRVRIFDPKKITYVVGEEQTAYFKDLFNAARAAGIAAAGEREFVHAATGLYVDRVSGKKLSSRAGAESVFTLLDAAREFFEKKYAAREYAVGRELRADEIRENAEKLARGSIIFNDLRKDRTLAVEFDSDKNAMLKSFEDSGGAYLMYALARARGILRAYGGEVPSESSFGNISLVPVEVALIKKILQFPDIILKAERGDNPGFVGNYLFELARDYQSYYAGYPVLEKGSLKHPHRLVITDAARITLENGFRLLGIEAPAVL